MSEDYCHYASLYREALQSNSPFYRFLCLFKIVEGLHKRRGRLTIEAKRQGTFTSRKPLIPERIPSAKANKFACLKRSIQFVLTVPGTICSLPSLFQSNRTERA